MTGLFILAVLALVSSCFWFKMITPPSSQKVETPQPSHHSIAKIVGWNHQIQVWQWKPSNVLTEENHNLYLLKSKDFWPDYSFWQFRHWFLVVWFKMITPSSSQKVETPQPSHHSMAIIVGWNHQIQVWQWRLSNVLTEKNHNQYLLKSKDFWPDYSIWHFRYWFLIAGSKWLPHHPVKK